MDPDEDINYPAWNDEVREILLRDPIAAVEYIEAARRDLSILRQYIAELESEVRPTQ